MLIHPLGAELVVWEPVMERLARERDVIAVDLPGFGALARAGQRHARRRRCSRAASAGLLDELGIRRAHVAGNSLGGWVALELAKAGRALSRGRAVHGGAVGAAAGAEAGPRPARRGPQA